MKQLAGAFVFCALAFSAAGAAPPPIIDMHLHAYTLEDFGGGMPVCTNDQKIVFPGPDPRQPMTIEKLMECERPVAAAATNEAVREREHRDAQTVQHLGRNLPPIERSRDRAALGSERFVTPAVARKHLRALDFLARRSDA